MLPDPQRVCTYVCTIIGAPPTSSTFPTQQLSIQSQYNSIDSSCWDSSEYCDDIVVVNSPGMYFTFRLSATWCSLALLRATMIVPQVVMKMDFSFLLTTSLRQSVESGYLMSSTSTQSALPVSFHFSPTPLSSSTTNSRSDTNNWPKAKWRYSNCYNINSNNMNGIHDNTKLSGHTSWGHRMSSSFDLATEQMLVFATTELHTSKHLILSKHYNRRTLHSSYYC